MTYSYIIFIQFTTPLCVKKDTRLYTYTSYYISISFIIHGNTLVKITTVQCFQLFISFTYVRYLSPYYRILYVFNYFRFAFSLLLSLFWTYIPHCILDYYLSHIVVYNHNHIFRYKSTNLVMHRSPNHIVRCQSTTLVIHWSPNDISTSLRVMQTSYNLIRCITLGNSANAPFTACPKPG